MLQLGMRQRRKATARQKSNKYEDLAIYGLIQRELKRLAWLWIVRALAAKTGPWRMPAGAPASGHCVSCSEIRPVTYALDSYRPHRAPSNMASNRVEMPLRSKSSRESGIGRRGPSVLSPKRRGTDCAEHALGYSKRRGQGWEGQELRRHVCSFSGHHASGLKVKAW
jgi:hypothetical protein